MQTWPSDKPKKTPMRQVELRAPDGARMVAWIEKEHAIVGRRMDFNMGDGKRTPVMEVIQAWTIERDITEISQRQSDQRDYGGSIH